MVPTEGIAMIDLRRYDCTFSELRQRNGQLARALAELDPQHPALTRRVGFSGTVLVSDLVDTALAWLSDRATTDQMRQAIEQVVSHYHTPTTAETLSQREANRQRTKLARHARHRPTDS